MLVWTCAACGGGGGEGISVGDAPDGATSDTDTSRMDGDEDEDPDPVASGCDIVEVDGSRVIERERDFTATFSVGAPYTKTVMLFGGERLEDENLIGNAYILGLDKADAQMLAMQYPDFYLCSSAGGMAAADHILPYDLVPASCEIYDQITAALRTLHSNENSGGDRTSIRFEGAPLEVESVLNPDGVDVKDEVSDQSFHLVTSVEQLTGESVLAFGASE